MVQSSGSLFHYTRRFEVLKSILVQGFRYSESMEELPNVGFSQHVDKYLNAVRSVCFCDIPLSQSMNHRSQYGAYAIALSKSWGMNVGVTPIRYLHRNSPDVLAHFFRRMAEISQALFQLDGGVYEFYSHYLDEIGYEHPVSFEKDILDGSAGLQKVMQLIEDDYTEILTAYSRLIALSRIYEGEWTDRETETPTRRRFYDEREWRSISFLDDGANLEFRFSDINYIIVGSLSEKEDIAKFLMAGSALKHLGPVTEAEVWTKLLVGDIILQDI